MWKKVRSAVLSWLESWPPLERFECWRDEQLGRRVDERPDSFHWVGGIPQRRKDLILGTITGHGLPWKGWRNWVSKWIEPQPGLEAAAVLDPDVRLHVVDGKGNGDWGSLALAWSQKFRASWGPR